MTQSERLIYLPHCLDRAAYTAYSNLTLTQRASYDSILDALQEQYGPTNRRAKLFKKLYSTKQLPGQSVNDYACDIQKKMNHLDVTDPTQIMY